ncbi:MAG: hypothetical protein Fur0020_10700 [Thermodesulfovibrionia bacterium]
MPKAVLDVTAQDEKGERIFSKGHEFTVNDLYFKGGKQVAMAEWDVTATEHFDLGVRPIEPYRFTYIIPLNPSMRFIDATAEFRYLYSRDRRFDVQKVTQRVNIE